MAKRLNVLDESNLFLNPRLCFRKGLGACCALFTISSAVQKLLDSGHKVRLIGLELSAAYDCVNHSNLNNWEMG